MFHINEYDQDPIADGARSIDDISRAATLQRDVPVYRKGARINRQSNLPRDRKNDLYYVFVQLGDVNAVKNANATPLYRHGSLLFIVARVQEQRVFSERQNE